MLESSILLENTSPRPVPPSSKGKAHFSHPHTGFIGGDHILSGGDGILLITEKGHISYANHAAERMFLSAMGGLRGKKFGFPLHEGITEIDIFGNGNSRTRALMQCSVIPKKKRMEYLVTVRSLNQLREQMSESGLRSELLSKVINHSPIGIIVTNLSGQVTVWSNAAAKMLGWSAQDTVGHELPMTAEGIQESLADVWHRASRGEVLTGYELIGQRREDGRLVDLQIWSVLIQSSSGLPSGTMFMLADMTMHRRMKAHLRHAIGHDTLTGLPNRRQFKSQLKRTLDKIKTEKDNHLIVITLGIDRFKTINMSLGHTEGDYLLQQVTQRLAGVLYEIDVISRTGGDEFSILLRDTLHVRDGTRVAEKLLQAIRSPFELNDREVFLTASIGIAVFPSDGDSADAMIHAADSAMDRSKEKGGDCYQYFAEDLDERVRSQLFLEQELHHAIDREQLYLDYQPQWDISTGEMIGVEALLRWAHPTLGQIPPSTFIPIAESSGLIIPIGAMVLKKSCQQLSQWDMCIGKRLRMAVNVSPRQFQATTLKTDVINAINESGISPDRLELEITESMMANDIGTVTQTLHELKALGICISIDDFGTGYSSLSYLASLPVDTLKIDQSFVRGIDQKPGCNAIIASVLELVRGLNLRAIAEGIETESQLDFLKKLGCDEGQGYLMGKPMTPSNLAMLAQPHRLSC